MSRRILITGASIAGNAAAWWLSRFGFDVSVVERASEFRDGGQNVDVRGVGRDVLRRMGLEQAALDHGTGETGTAWVDARGRVTAEFIAGEFGGDGPTAEMEILRGDLARLLFEGARDRVNYRFGDRIARIDDGPGGAEVVFASGRTESFALVVVAEGVGSQTRELVFPGENDPRWMDLTLAFFTIPRTSDDDQRWRWYNATRGRSVSLRPDQHHSTRAMLSVQHKPEGVEAWDGERQKQWLRLRFADAGWQAPRVLDGMQTTRDFYVDTLRQVRLKRWWRSNVVLTGDAAWCATPLAGIGTTLAVTGAYVLAAELQRTADIPTALTRYEAAMRPMVEGGQAVPKIVPRLMNPHSRLGINVLHGALALASRPTVRRLAGKLFDRGSKEPDLSAYPS